MAEVLPEPAPPSNRGLWMLVIGLGIAILLVVAAMIGMAVKRAMFDKPAQVTATLTPGEVPELNLELPAGAAIAEARLEGAMLLVRVQGPAGEEVLLIDPARSRVASRVRFNRAAP